MDQGAEQSWLIVYGQRGGVRGRSASARPVDLAGQLGKPVGHRAVTKAHRGVQSADLRGELVVRRGQLGGLPGQRQGLAEAALGGGHPRLRQEHLRFEVPQRWMLRGRLSSWCLLGSRAAFR
ncbi:MAG TPA: hypothetical protein VJ757_04505 [Pseudonocardiaceae bacterium]|nr:hypothetical protein [Pseudonocardiaceae bacterium]